VSQTQVSAVPTEHVLDVWAAVEGYIANALEYTYGRYEPEDILKDLLAGTHLLWIAFDDARIKGAVITHILQYPRKRFLGCPVVTGDDFAAWKDPMLSLLQRFASDNKCDGLEATARLGWARIFKGDGYEALWQTFQLPAGVNNG
jgi:hypothetical protein